MGISLTDFRVRGTHRHRYQYELVLHDACDMMAALEGIVVELVWQRGRAQAVSHEVWLIISAFHIYQSRVTAGTVSFGHQRLSLYFFMEKDDKTHKFIEKPCKLILREVHFRISHFITSLRRNATKNWAVWNLIWPCTAINRGQMLLYQFVEEHG